ncbi:ComC/BlpC family leader-containing pheromone/bacteriocin [Cellulosilyticum ruminicola]|nr:ComC/BlpC family leader-containing pheromone/bacteriocin [Cellulosilyticum ruminicola]
MGDIKERGGFKMNQFTEFSTTELMEINGGGKWKNF